MLNTDWYDRKHILNRQSKLLYKNQRIPRKYRKWLSFNTLFISDIIRINQKERKEIIRNVNKNESVENKQPLLRGCYGDFH